MLTLQFEDNLLFLFRRFERTQYIPPHPKVFRLFHLKTIRQSCQMSTSPCTHNSLSEMTNDFFRFGYTFFRQSIQSILTKKKELETNDFFQPLLSRSKLQIQFLILRFEMTFFNFSTYFSKNS